MPTQLSHVTFLLKTFNKAETFSFAFKNIQNPDPIYFLNFILNLPNVTPA